MLIHAEQLARVSAWKSDGFTEAMEAAGEWHGLRLRIDGQAAAAIEARFEPAGPRWTPEPADLTDPASFQARALGLPKTGRKCAGCGS